VTDETWRGPNKTEEPTFRPGLYQHYKGPSYTALGIVEHHETHLPYVLYVSHTTGKVKFRPLNPVLGDPDGWADWVEWEGKRVRRFAYLGEKAHASE
jgi:hypothetical protein